MNVFYSKHSFFCPFCVSGISVGRNTGPTLATPLLAKIRCDALDRIQPAGFYVHGNEPTRHI
jgi:hypothetical protein